MTSRTPPASVEAERAVFGSALVRPTCVADILAELVTDDFFLPAHREIFDAVVAITRRGAPVDPLVLVEELRARGGLPKLENGQDYVMRLAGEVPTAENVGHYIRLVRERADLRRLITTTAEIQSRAYGEFGEYDQFIEEAEAAVFKVAQRRRVASASTTGALMGGLIHSIEHRHRDQRAITGVPTGLGHFDRLTAGLQPEHLIVVAARPGVGKTSWALNLVANASIRHKLPCLVFSLEMTKMELLERMLSGEARVAGEDLRIGNLTAEDWRRRIYPAAAEIAAAPVVIDDAGAQSILQMAATARRFRANPDYFPTRPEDDPTIPLGLVVVDYVQLARGTGGKSQNREQEIGEITRGLKALAKAIKLPIVAVSQLNRDLEKRTDKRPLLSDLRESGSIEQDADLIVFIHRDDYYDREGPDVIKGRAELLLRKNRHGQTGTCLATWLPHLARFENYGFED